MKTIRSMDPFFLGFGFAAFFRGLVKSDELSLSFCVLVLRSRCFYFRKTIKE